MTNAEKKKKQYAKVKQELDAVKNGRKSLDQLSATAKARLNRKVANKRAYQNR